MRYVFGDYSLDTQRYELCRAGVLIPLQALDLVRTRKERGHEAWTLRLLGEITAQHQPLDAEQAEAHYRQALALAKALGMRPLQAHCHYGLGTLCAEIGQPAQAHNELCTATGLSRSMGMTFWQPQTEMALMHVAKR